MKRSKISEKVIVGGQPSAEDLRGLREEGVTTIVNLRLDGEDNQALSPKAEGDEARQVGLSYHHVPVSLANLSRDQIDAVRKVVAEGDGPVYVHCGGGQRGCAFGLLAEGLPSAGHLFDRSAAEGFPVHDERLSTFIKSLKPED
jgi:uncharacterized protein (TIGR01244 family)